MIGEHLNWIASSTKSENDDDNSTMADFGKAQVRLKGSNLLLHMVAGLHLPKTNRVFQIICPKAKSMLECQTRPFNYNSLPEAAISCNFQRSPSRRFVGYGVSKPLNYLRIKWKGQAKWCPVLRVDFANMTRLTNLLSCLWMFMINISSCMGL